jgi:hypothetical protein
MARRLGFLAIWCEIGNDDLMDYRAWLTQEHIADRIRLPGFLSMRLFASPQDECAHFFLYLTESVDVLKGAGYRAVLDNPSPWTRRIMPRFGPFDRALGEQALKLGSGFGSHVLVSRIRTGSAPATPAALQPALRGLLDIRDVVAARWLVTDRAVTGAASQEKTMRSSVGHEGRFDALLVVEATSESGAAAAQVALEPALRTGLGDLESWDSSVRRVVYAQAPHDGDAS